MILVDTSIWIDHFRKADRQLTSLLENERVMTHPFVIGEIALGHLKHRGQVLDSLANLATSAMASEQEVLAFIEAEMLQGSGIGYLDAHLLAAAKITPGTSIWTRDKRLRAAAAALKLDMKEASQ
jgi:predicted nucleic acid-binding protein